MSSPDRTGAPDREALDRYDALRAARPELFANPPGAAFEIVFDPREQAAVAAGVRYEDAYQILVRDAVRFRDGRVGPYIRMISVGDYAGAVVLPVLGERILLVRHFRHATRDWHWEAPRGFADPGEEPVECARRELREELGCTATDLRPLGILHTDTGTGGSPVHLFWARVGGSVRPGELEGLEGIDGLRAVTVAEFRALIAAGELTDSFTLCAYVYADARALLTTGG